MDLSDLNKVEQPENREGGNALEPRRRPAEGLLSGLSGGRRKNERRGRRADRRDRSADALSYVLSLGLNTDRAVDSASGTVPFDRSTHGERTVFSTMRSGGESPVVSDPIVSSRWILTARHERRAAASAALLRRPIRRERIRLLPETAGGRTLALSSRFTPARIESPATTWYRYCF
jgi:hypothetical protein